METRTYEEITETLIRCNGITITVMLSSQDKADTVKEQFLSTFQMINHFVPILLKVSKDKIEFQNTSLIEFISYDPAKLCGRRAHQIIVDEDNYNNPKMMREVFQPFITCRSTRVEYFVRGIFVLDESPPLP